MKYIDFNVKYFKIYTKRYQINKLKWRIIYGLCISRFAFTFVFFATVTNKVFDIKLLNKFLGERLESVYSVKDIMDSNSILYAVNLTFRRLF